MRQLNCRPFTTLTWREKKHSLAPLVLRDAFRLAEPVAVLGSLALRDKVQLKRGPCPKPSPQPPALTASRTLLLCPLRLLLAASFVSWSWQRVETPFARILRFDSRELSGKSKPSKEAK